MNADAFAAREHKERKTESADYADGVDFLSASTDCPRLRPFPLNRPADTFSPTGEKVRMRGRVCKMVWPYQIIWWPTAMVPNRKV